MIRFLALVAGWLWMAIAVVTFLSKDYAATKAAATISVTCFLSWIAYNSREEQRS